MPGGEAGRGGLYAATCHVLVGGRSLCGDRTNSRPGCAGSGANHCLLVSFPLLSELLSRTAPTGRKEEGWGCEAEGRGKPGVQQAFGDLVGLRKGKSKENGEI